MELQERDLAQALRNDILVLDGAMGTMLQRNDAAVSDMCNDVLCLTDPEAVSEVHRAYLRAGAHIIETNSFNANALSLADYGYQDRVEEINMAAARVAREAVKAENTNAWVAGSVGPTGRSLTLSLSEPDKAAANFDEFVEAMRQQMRALIRGGVDLLLIETVFDSLNARASACAARLAMDDAGRDVPVIFSVTLTQNGRTLSGSTPESIFAAVSHLRPVAFCLNCGFGIEHMERFVDGLATLPVAVGIYPNAGLPDALGNYNDTPEQMAQALSRLMSAGRLNLVGGCCGTTPEHIAAIAQEARSRSPRPIPEPNPLNLTLSGLDIFTRPQGSPLIKVGERCNVAGSRKFLRLVKEGNLAEAVAIAEAQVKAGADIIDLNVDDPMLDAPCEMCRMLAALAGNPVTASVPVMVDSSAWPVVTAALKCLPGKGVVNSISLKDGEEKFLEKARFIARMGAAVVVMAFDEQGQAVTFERRIEVCARAYRLLVDKAGFNPSDIIFDPNILAVGTGIAEHNRYALDFLKATEWITRNLPGARISGGLSNLSFAFRGNNPLREAIHARFLKMATERGLSMAIVNPSSLVDPDSIDPVLADAIDALLLDKSPGALEHLIDVAPAPPQKKETKAAPQAESAPKTAAERLQGMVVNGLTSGMEEIVNEAMRELGSAMAVVDKSLMPGMNIVGERFGRGEMFLPQVVKSAGVMKEAVAVLSPHMEGDGGGASGRRPRMVLATVKGDVHDIGKNIVAVVMRCNGFDVTDLGVMVSPEKIVEEAVRINADMVGLSGLITPSLSEMCAVADAMEQASLHIPLMVGGAAASAEHTALIIAPRYSGVTVYTRDAASLPPVARRLADPATRAGAEQEIRALQQRLREGSDEKSGFLSLGDARSRKPAIDFTLKAPAPLRPGEHTFNIPVAEARKWINARAFFAAWELDASFAEMTAIGGCDHCRAQWLAAVPENKRKRAAEAMQLWKNANRMLDNWCAEGLALTARVILAPAHSDTADNIHILLPDGENLVIPTLRHVAEDGQPPLALSDFIAADSDHIGLFAVTCGAALAAKGSADDSFQSILAQTLTDRLVEGAAEMAHLRVRRHLWGYAPAESGEPRTVLRAEYQGIRPAVGYPSLPDQSLVHLLDRALRYGELGVTPTENGALSPASTVTGLFIAHPQSHYFIVGEPGDEQIKDYCLRRGFSSDADPARFFPRSLRK